MNEEELKSAVSKLLVNEHDFEIEEANETVDQSVVESPDMWNEKAIPEDLAKYLASGEGND